MDFAFEVNQKVVVMTDDGRGGVVLERSTEKFKGENAYLIAGQRNGVPTAEWYPELSLRDVAAPESDQPSHKETPIDLQSVSADVARPPAL